MKTANELYDRFMNLKEVQKIEQVEIIQVGFSEDDVKSIIYWLGLVKHLSGGINLLDPLKHTEVDA